MHSVDDTYFVEFKTGSIDWNQDLIMDHNNVFIDASNRVVETIDKIYSNMSIYEGSYVIGFREGVYVSLKLQFNNEDVNNLDPFIGFLREGGGQLLTDRVYLKLGKIADCIINYIDTTFCDCTSMFYKRAITCRQPDIYGGEPCPEKCTTGHMIASPKACSWDDLDAFKCAAATKAVDVMLLFLIAAIFALNTLTRHLG
ncbi:uncharacterized protein [Montipora capricornis]|uniref:uncharacterized protein n=1 Tax=Montipora capricornis TaxID=246305 RepID=UPI0035F1FB3A